MSELTRVLIVEDLPTDAELCEREVSRVLPQCEFLRVETRDDFLAALESLRPDLILAGFKLPRFDGLTALKLTQEHAPGTPFIIVTASMNEDTAVECFKAGVWDYIVKQHIKRLGSAVLNALDQKRLRAERLLAEERARRWERVFEKAQFGLTHSDPRDHTFIEVNATFARERGYTPDELKGRSILEIYAPEDREAAQQRLRRLRPPGHYLFEATHMRKDGSRFPVLVEVTAIEGDQAWPASLVAYSLDITERKLAEEALQTANRQLRQLSSDLLRSQDYERRRIARELHDSTSQLLAALSMNLSRLGDSEMGADRRRQLLSEAIDLAAACSAEIRTVTYLLHPPLLDQIGLTAALQGYAQGFNQRTGIQVEIDIPADFGRLSSEMESTLFRIVQEGLANVHKHSGSRQAIIRLQRDASEVRLVLQDLGHGFPEALHPQAEGFVRFGVGILGMRERAEQLGGRLELSSDNAGTTLTVTLPMVYSHEEDTSIVGR
jgi:PAS domain S-box-containing protein